jgi:hypothetical protein
MLQLNLSWARVLTEQALAYPSKVRNEDVTIEYCNTYFDGFKMLQSGGDEYGARQAAQNLTQRLRCMELKDKQACSSNTSRSKDLGINTDTTLYHVSAEAAALHSRTRPEAGWSTPCSTAHSSGTALSPSLATVLKVGSQLHYSRELRAAAEQLLGSQS